MPAIARKLAVLTTLSALALGGCGGGSDGATSSGGATGAQGATGPTGGEADITAGHFLQKILPDKEVALEAVVATSEACAGVKVEPSFVLVVSDAASKADPGDPLTPIVEAQC